MGELEALLREAELAPIEGWNFGWLDGRAVEERPSWRYFDRVAERSVEVASLLEVQAGVGSMIGMLPRVPQLSVATEGFAPSLVVAGPRLRARGVFLVPVSQTNPGLPFHDQSFELVISRHPIQPWWTEIARVLKPGGSYLAQHVGPHSLRSLSEFFLGPLPEDSKRDPILEREAAQKAGLSVDTLAMEQLRTAFFDLGAVVYFLRLVPWIVPDFSVTRFYDELARLHALLKT
ncbi:MAG: methyltransferase domain-containing protein, partial [Acidimicrobiales bacterium]